MDKIETLDSRMDKVETFSSMTGKVRMDKALAGKAEIVSILKNASQMLACSWDVNPLDEKDNRWKILEALAVFIKEETTNKPKPNVPNYTMGLSSWDDVIQLLMEIDYLLVFPAVVKTISHRIFNIACRLREDGGMIGMVKLILCYSVERPVWELARFSPYAIFLEACSANKGSDESKGKAVASVEQMTSLLSMDGMFIVDAYKLAEDAARWCIGQSTEDAVRVLDCISWREIPFFEFPALVNRLLVVFPAISTIYPRLLVEFASAMTTYTRNADVASLSPKPTRHDIGGIWRQYSGPMGSPEGGGDGDEDTDKRPGIICLDPSPGRVFIDDQFSQDQWWDVSGVDIAIQSGDEIEVHTVNGSPDFILTAVGEYPRCEKLKDDRGFSRHRITTTFTGTFHVRVGPRIHPIFIG